ncbi:MAG: response regulator [Chloroflexi bacterium]|nr:MAG: hypothetical protein CUN54_00400 [Phototrophicales bacterium]RMF79316.1 MAG: response regulator [Chloroflexota bacterium]
MAQKILVADDDIDSLKLIGLMLQRHGYEVVAASTGQQAYSRATSELPDLIILDVMMPDVNGYEVCRRLRAEEATKNIPIIMFTAKTMVDDKVAGFEAGADDYLTKPTHPAELASRVRSMLARSAQQAPAAAIPQVRSVQNPTIGFIGAKGGVGTTTVALNVGAAMMQQGTQPIVTDIRPGMGTMALMLGIRSSGGLGNLLTKQPDDIKPDLVESAVVKHQSGLRLLLSSSRPAEARLNITSVSMATTIDRISGLSDMAIFDLGSGLSSLTFHSLERMEQIVLVVEPTGVTLRIGREIIDELENAGYGGGEQLHVVAVSRSQSAMQTSWQETEHILGREIRSIISAAPELAFQASEAGMPMVLFQPSAIVASQLNKLAEDLNARSSGRGGMVKPLK